MKKTKNKDKEEYGLFSNVIYNIKAVKKWDKRLFYYQFLLVLPTVVSVYLGILLPAELVRGLENKWNLMRLFFHIFLLAFFIWILQMAAEEMQEYMYRNSLTQYLYYQQCCCRKIMKLDYDMLEEPKKRKLIGDTWNVIRNGYGIRTSVLAVPKILCGGLGILWYGTMVGKRNILLVVFMLVNMLLSFWLLSLIRKKHSQYHEKVSDYTSKTAYISRQSMERTAGKEIRIYQMMDWFLKKYDENLKGIDDIYGKIHNWYFYKSLVDGLLAFLMEGFAYCYLIYLLLMGEMGASDFVLCIGLIREFGMYFEMLVVNLQSLNSMNASISYIRKFTALPDSRKKAEGIGEEKLALLKKGGVKVELRNVSYSYPGEEKRTLSGINLVIRPGEKLALIGLNGAGKTTLVKLLCGFYQPSEGEVLINDIPAGEFGREEYYSLISVMFQDSTLLPQTLDENLTGQPQEEIDRRHLEWSLRISGFWEKYESLPEKGNTLLVREANKEALDFSGGEKQKMLFARALYKKAPLLILDEPTAALDPIAENELYLKYSMAAEGRTSIYISHRLSSTRFCDRILLLSHGEIVEEGTHEELMQKKGRYAKLFAVQSQYYKKLDENKRLREILEDTFEEDQGEMKGVFYEQAGL